LSSTVIATVCGDLRPGHDGSLADVDATDVESPVVTGFVDHSATAEVAIRLDGRVAPVDE